MICVPSSNIFLKTLILLYNAKVEEFLKTQEIYGKHFVIKYYSPLAETSQVGFLSG